MVCAEPGLFLVICPAAGAAVTTPTRRGREPRRCTAVVTVAPENTGDGWVVSTPAAEQMDTSRVLAAMQNIRDGGAPGVDSLLVVRNGRLVAESYFNGFAPRHGA